MINRFKIKNSHFKRFFKIRFSKFQFSGKQKEANILKHEMPGGEKRAF